MRAKNPLHARSHDPGGSDPVMFAWEDVGDGAGTGGIQFETSPQAGGWLDISTTATDGDGYGIHLEASDTILVEGDSVTIDATDAAGQLLLHSDQNTDLKAEKNLVIEGGINAGTTGSGVAVTATHGTLVLQSSAGQTLIQASGGNTVFVQGLLVSLGGFGGVANGVAVDFVLDAGTNFRVLNSAGSAVFRIDETDGSVHIKTGTSVVADL